jgi:hypothetical protein
MSNKLKKRIAYVFTLFLSVSHLALGQEVDVNLLPEDSTTKVDINGVKSAKESWEKLTKRFKKRPEFAFAQNNPKLPNVLMYGDSISIGYTQRVRAKVGSRANVYRLYHNGGSSNSYIPMMTKMHSTMREERLDHAWTFQWDVIHLNVGLHDLTVINMGEEEGKHVSKTSIDVYKNNLRDIVTYLQQLAPNAKLIFATTN